MSKHIEDASDSRVARHIERMLNRGYIRLGAGSWSLVITKPGWDWTIKIGRGDDGWRHYAEYCREHSYCPYLPTIRRVFDLQCEDYFVAIVKRYDKMSNGVKDFYNSRIDPFAYFNEYRHEEEIEVTYPGLTKRILHLNAWIRNNGLGRDYQPTNILMDPDTGYPILNDPVCL